MSDVSDAEITRGIAERPPPPTAAASARSPFSGAGDGGAGRITGVAGFEPKSPPNLRPLQLRPAPPFEAKPTSASVPATTFACGAPGGSGGRAHGGGPVRGEEREVQPPPHLGDALAWAGCRGPEESTAGEAVEGRESGRPKSTGPSSGLEPEAGMGTPPPSPPRFANGEFARRRMSQGGTFSFDSEACVPGGREGFGFGDARGMRPEPSAETRDLNVADGSGATNEHVDGVGHVDAVDTARPKFCAASTAAPPCSRCQELFAECATKDAAVEYLSGELIRLRGNMGAIEHLAEQQASLEQGSERRIVCLERELEAYKEKLRSSGMSDEDSRELSGHTRTWSRESSDSVLSDSMGVHKVHGSNRFGEACASVAWEQAA